MNEASFTPTNEDFLPAGKRQTEAGNVRPSISYWQDAWSRFRGQRRSLAALLTVVFLVLFSLVGPLLWSVDPAAQDLSQISRGPALHRTALLVASSDAWPDQEADIWATASGTAPDATFALAGQATTESTKLLWQPVPSAASYRLFRHEYRPEYRPDGPLDLGIPLVSLDASQTRYRDRLALEAINYWYSLQALAADDSVLATTTIEARPEQAMTVEEARRRGLLGSDFEGIAAGSRIRLSAHPLGTDYLGRDLLARLMYGGRTSLLVGMGAPFIFVLFGLFYGGLSAYLAGVADREMMRFADFVLALPFLLFMILFKILFGIGAGESGILPMMVGLVLLSWPATARLVRGQVLPLREVAYVQAARLAGAGPLYIIARHMAPNILSVVLVSLTFAIPVAIFTEAFLSFIGMGVVPPTPSWGSLCNDGLKNMLSHPHELLFPAAFISITVLAFNLLGDGLRDALDVKLRMKQ